MSNLNNYVFSDNSSQPWYSQKNNITRVEIGQKIQPASTVRWFALLTNMSSGDFTNLDTSKVTDMSWMFLQVGDDLSVTSFELVGLNNWDTSKVTNMYGMFKGTKKFNQPLDNWDGVKQCFDYAPVSFQYTPGIDKDSFWTKEMHPTGPEYEVSEDSLYLNIFTPARDDKAMLPVLFYIHGGGFTGGYPSEIEFDWEHMAK